MVLEFVKSTTDLEEIGKELGITRFAVKERLKGLRNKFGIRPGSGHHQEGIEQLLDAVEKRGYSLKRAKQKTVTPRDSEILELVALGYSYEKIEERLKISRAIRKHITHVSKMSFKSYFS